MRLPMFSEHRLYFNIRCKIVIFIFLVTTPRARGRWINREKVIPGVRDVTRWHKFTHTHTRARGGSRNISFPYRALADSLLILLLVVGRTAFLFCRILLRAATLWTLLSLRQTLSPFRCRVAKNHAALIRKGTPHSNEKFAGVEMTKERGQDSS